MSTLEYALHFTIQLLEDTHTGTGMGRLGLVDDTQSRDQNGRPIIWGSTLRGLMREAGEDWLLARQQAGANPDCLREQRKLLYRLFGLPLNKTVTGQARERGICQVRSLRLASTDDRDLPDMFNQWTATAREVHSRRPMDETLRTVETVSAGVRFEGEIRWQCESQEADDVSGLIKTCLQRITAIGSAKTRGLGQVRLLLSEPYYTQLPTPKSEKNQLLHALERLPEDQPVILHLALRNLEPLNLLTTTFASNLNYSLTYLPGSTLRGAILHWISRRQPGLADTLADPLQFRVSNGYVVPKARRGTLRDWEVLPAPLSLREFKAGTGPASTARAEQHSPPWWARGEAGGDLLGQRDERDAVAEADNPKRIGQRKRIKAEEYLVRRRGQSLWQRVRPRMGVLLRNRVPTERRDPDHRGAGSQPGFQGDELFSEQVLWDGQTFLCRLWFANRKAAEQFATVAAPLMTGAAEQRSWLRVGRGGRPVRIEAIEWQAAGNPAEDAETTAPEAAPRPTADRLTVTLTSDLIGRTPWLTFATDPAPADWIRWIEHAAKQARLNVSLPKSAQLQIDDDRTVVETIDVYGFNSATGLPRAVGIALKRGSVITFKPAGQQQGEAVDKLRQALLLLAKQGVPLGERIAEGFGQFLVDLDVHRHQYWSRVAEPQAEKSEALKEVSEVWQEAVLAKVLAFENQIQVDPRSKNAPSVTQWQWLRHQAEAASTVSQPVAPETEEELRLQNLGRLLDDLAAHADTLSGAQWKGLVDKIRAAIDEFSEFKHKQLFLTAMAQSAVAKARRERKAEKKGEPAT